MQVKKADQPASGRFTLSRAGSACAGWQPALCSPSWLPHAISASIWFNLVNVCGGAGSQCCCLSRR